MNFQLDGKKVFITGSTSGIGLSIARKFQEYGCHVTINSKNQSSLNNITKLFSTPVKGILGDISNPNDAKYAIEKFIELNGSIDILICNIGSGISSPPFKETIQDWENSISINLFSAINPISESIKYFNESGGAITCISSICGNKMIENAPLTYSSIKAALNRYVINSSFYLAKHNIRINAVSPGNVFFKGSVWDTKLKNDQKSVNKMLIEKVPLNKFVSPENVAEAVAFLSSPLSESTTGQILSVDAGQSCL